MNLRVLFRGPDASLLQVEL